MQVLIQRPEIFARCTTQPSANRQNAANRHFCEPSKVDFGLDFLLFYIEIIPVGVRKLQKVAIDILKLKKYISDGFPMTSVRLELEKPSMVALVPISAVLDGCVVSL